jgi:hypothetical protein
MIKKQAGMDDFMVRRKTHFVKEESEVQAGCRVVADAKDSFSEAKSGRFYSFKGHVDLRQVD